MAVPFALMAAGTGLQIAGQIYSNLSGSSAERENEQYYREQAEYAREAARRAEKIAEFDYTTKVGTQISAYAAGGVAMSGSASTTVAGTVGNMVNEILAIRKKGALESRLAEMRASQSGSRANLLSSPGYNILQGGATLLNNYTMSGGFGKGFPDWMSPDKAASVGNTYTHFSSQLPSSGGAGVGPGANFAPTNIMGLRL